MKDKTLVKVVGTIISGSEGSRLVTTLARGISPLKRGQTMLDFISTFLKDREITTYALHQREEKLWVTSPIMSLNVEPRTIVTYSFLEFSSSELGYQAKDLAPHELERDMKHLKKIVHG